MVLVPIVQWVLEHHLPDTPLEPQFAQWHALPKRPKDLAGQLRAALRLCPCDLLLVHRDAEKESPQKRVVEIAEAVQKLTADRTFGGMHVCIVPVRMSEAWLLFDEAAIRTAAANPNGTAKLDLPPLKRAESIPHPKQVLKDALETASELSGRRLAKFNALGQWRRVAKAIHDFSPLRQLPAFRAFEDDIRAFAAAWLPPE